MAQKVRHSLAELRELLLGETHLVDHGGRVAAALRAVCRGCVLPQFYLMTG